MNHTHARSEFEWKQTDGQTDRHTDGGDCIIPRANAVAKEPVRHVVQLLMVYSV